MKQIKKSFILIQLLLLFRCCLYGADKFIFAQFKYPGNWDPYPTIYKDIIEILELTTSVEAEKERVILDLLSDKLRYEIFKVPFVILLGDDEVMIPHKNIKVLRDYLINGGTIFIEDTSELYNSKFDESIRRILKVMFPDYRLKKTDKDFVLMKSFYLIRKVTGRIAMYNYLEYIEYEKRPIVIYSRNNMIACWARDRLGNYIYTCIPDGEQQRFNSQKLFLNIIMYSLCGTYKMDKVHQPYIQERLKR